MPSNIRFSDETVDTSVLGEEIVLPFSGLVAPNRFMKGPMTERLSSWDEEDLDKRGKPTQALIDLYERWGEGQIGVIITGNIMVDPGHLESTGNATLHTNHDNRLEDFRKIAAAGKKHGSLIIAQVSHPGRQTEDKIQPNPVSASDVHLESAIMKNFAKPTPLTKQGIKDIVNKFATVAEYLYQAGFDGIQLHGAHGYLLAQFLATTTNKRTDEYGGSLENRSRIIFEIVEEIRRRVPDTKFSLSIKLNSVEFQSGAFTTEDCRDLCKKLEEYGLDFIDLSGGTYESLAFDHVKDSTRRREAFFLEFAELIRPHLQKTKVYVTGGFRTAGGMADAIAQGSCDGIGIGRPLCDEPQLCAKILSKSHDVYAARKPLGLEGSLKQLGLPIDLSSLWILTGGLQLTLVARGFEPLDISDEKESKEIVQALLNRMQADAVLAAEKGVLSTGHTAVEGWNMAYVSEPSLFKAKRVA
ncbi:NADH-dependent flavin oxidoreductase [Rhizina undulata]